MARLGSGSATRSIHPNGWVAWLPGGTNDSVGYLLEECALPPNWHAYALVFDEKHKKIPSREGHRLMDTSPKRAERIKNANRRFLEVCHAVQKMDWKTMCHVVYEETLEFVSLLQSHSVMKLYHNPSAQRALKKCESIFKSEKDLGPWTYTVDAGSTVYILGDEAVVEEVVSRLKVEPVLLLTSRIYGGLQKIKDLENLSEPVVF